MRSVAQALVAVAFGVPLVLISTVALWFWLTIPAAPDAATLPSSVREAPAEAWAAAVEAGRNAARALIAEAKLPGLSVAVAVDGAVVWAEGFRWADLETETPVTPETRFRVGGISATFTAAAAGLLAERGRLDLDAPLSRSLPGVEDREPPLTLRRLLSHTAGVRDLRGETEIFRKTACAGDAERLALFVDDPLRFPPGSALEYSTYGPVLAGAAVSAAAGEPYLDFVTREIFEPLGMTGTASDGRQAGSVAGRVASFYYPRLMLRPGLGLQDAPRTDLSCVLPATGFLSTPSDLVRFGAATIAGAPPSPSPATVEDLWTPVRLASGASTAQAAAWIVLDLQLEPDAGPTRVVGAGLGAVVRRRPLSATADGGQVPGGTATLLLAPGPRVAVAVATNVSGAEGIPSLAVELARIFVRDPGR